MARLQKRGIDKFFVRLLDAMNVSELTDALAPGADWHPGLLAMQAHIITGDSKIRNRWTELLRREQPDLNYYLNMVKAEYYRRLQE